MYVYLLDRSLRVEVYYDETDRGFEDNICVSLVEECPDEEKIFKADETNIYLTCEQASHLVKAINKAIRSSTCDSNGKKD
jgi:hypothetical protein